MLPYTAADMLNKMQDEYGLDQPLDRSESGRSTPTSRTGRIHRAIKSWISTVTSF